MQWKTLFRENRLDLSFKFIEFIFKTCGFFNDQLVFDKTASTSIRSEHVVDGLINFNDFICHRWFCRHNLFIRKRTMEISTTTNASQNCIESKNYLPLQKRGLQRELLRMFSYWTFVLDHEWVTMCFCTLSGNFIYKIYAIDVKSGGRLAALNDWNWLTSIEKYWNHTEDVPFTYRRFLYVFLPFQSNSIKLADKWAG